MFPRAPAPLIGMLAAAAAVAAFSLQDHGVRLVGDIPGGLPAVALPAVGLADLSDLLAPALGVMIVAYVDNVLTARAFAARNGYAIDANQELLALGVTNLAVGCTQGFPVSSSGSRTVVGDALGSRSQLHSLVALARSSSRWCSSAPAGELPDRRAGRHRRVRGPPADRPRRVPPVRAVPSQRAAARAGHDRAACWPWASSPGSSSRSACPSPTCCAGSRIPTTAILGYVEGVAGMHDIDDHPDARLVPGLVVYRYDSPLFFANAEDFRSRALAAALTAPTPTEWFVLNAESNVEVDLTSLDAVEELRAELERRGVVFAMARVKQDLLVRLEAAGLAERVGAERIFPTLPTAVESYLKWYETEHGARPPGW